MPADDNPLDPQPTPEVDPLQNPEGGREIRPQEAADAAAIQSSGNLTLEQAAQMVQQAQQPLLDQMQQDRVDSEARFTQLADAVTNSGQQVVAAVTPPVEPTDFSTELLNGNAEVAITKLIDQRLGGYNSVLATVLQGGGGAFVDLEAQQIDTQFGPGAWDAHFRQPMETIMQNRGKVNPADLADRSVIKQEVNGLKGFLFDQLVDFRDKSRSEKKTNESEELTTLTDGVYSQVVNRMNSTGGGRAVTYTGSLETSPELDGYLAERNRSLGTNQTSKEWLTATDFGKDLDSFKEHQETTRNKSNGVPS